MVLCRSPCALAAACPRLPRRGLYTEMNVTATLTLAAAGAARKQVACGWLGRDVGVTELYLGHQRRLRK